MNSIPDRDSDRTRLSAREVDDATRIFGAEDLASAEDHEFELSDPAPHHASAISLLGDYLLLEQIGAGGMGQVFRAEHRTMNREVALKILSSSIAGQPQSREQFFAEIRAVAKLMHPNIVTAFDAGSVGDTHYLVMELVEGEVLSSRIRRLGPMTSDEAVQVIEQAAHALRYAHSRGIVHRDIKPSNMMLTDDGVLKILDFGLAQFGRPEVSEANKNMILGTPEFMSPEQIENPDAVDQRCDLYSLGATLFYLMTGRPMFTGEKMQVAIAQIRQKPPALFLARGDVDLRLDAVFQRLVEKRPNDRYASADELLVDLRKLGLTDALSTNSSDGKNSLIRGAVRLNDNPTSVALSHSTLAKRSQIVAIDLGMIASTAAYYDSTTGPVLVEQGEGSATYIRNILWSSDDQIKIGAAAAGMRQKQPQQVLHALQRRITTNAATFNMCGRSVPAVVALAALLRQIMSNASGPTDAASSAVVTVPSCYDQVHRRAIRDACQIAGIDLVQLLDKPLAAALSWLDVAKRLGQSSRQAVDERLLFVHLGGTGLEASVVRSHALTVEQLGVHGSLKHGSLRWQHLLTEYFVGVLEQQAGRSIREDFAGLTRLQRSVELVMERLSSSSKVEMRFDWQGAVIQQTITQQGLVKIAPELTAEIETAISGALAAAGISCGDIDQILLAGAMMRMKPVQEIVRSQFPSVPVSIIENSDLARGAALQAHFLAALTRSEGGERLQAVSRSSYDLGLLVSSPSSPGARVPKTLLEKSTPLPSNCTRLLRPKTRAGEGRVPLAALKIIESTSLGGNNWHLLTQVEPDELFPQRSGNQALQLRFEVDESGILLASLIWPEGNRQIPLEICSDSGFSRSTIDHWHHWLDTAMLCSTS